MLNKHSYIFVGLFIVALMAVFLTSCQEKKHKGGRTDTPTSGVVKIASDESFSPIVEEEREVFEGIYPQARIVPVYTNETDAMNDLLKGKICLVITSRDFSAKERKNLQDRKFMPVSIKLAYDGLALIVNRANTDTCLSVNDFKKILLGQITSWRQINPASNKGTMQVVFDTNKSSAIDWCVDSLLNGKAIANPNVFAAKTSKEVVNFVQKTPNAIGIIGSNWLNDEGDSTNTTFKKNVTVVSVSKADKATPMNSFKPYQYYLWTGAYPMIRTIYALLNDPINGLPYGFGHFLEMPIGQMVIYKTGLLPYRGDVVIRDVQVNDQ